MPELTIKDAREYKKALIQLVKATGIFLRGLDEVMKEPSTPERGKKIASLSNVLEYSRDFVRYSTLKIDFRKDPEIFYKGKRLEGRRTI